MFFFEKKKVLMQLPYWNKSNKVQDLKHTEIKSKKSQVQLLSLLGFKKTENFLHRRNFPDQ